MQKLENLRQILIHLNKTILGSEPTESLVDLWKNHAIHLSRIEKRVLLWVLDAVVLQNRKIFTKDLGPESRPAVEKFFRYVYGYLLEWDTYFVVHHNFRGASPSLIEGGDLFLSPKVKFFGNRFVLGLPALRLLRNLEKGLPPVISEKHFKVTKNNHIVPFETRGYVRVSR